MEDGATLYLKHDENFNNTNGNRVGQNSIPLTKLEQLNIMLHDTSETLKKVSTLSLTSDDSNIYLNSLFETLNEFGKTGELIIKTINRILSIGEKTKEPQQEAEEISTPTFNSFGEMLVKKELSQKIQNQPEMKQQIITNMIQRLVSDMQLTFDTVLPIVSTQSGETAAEQFSSKEGVSEMVVIGNEMVLSKDDKLQYLNKQEDCSNEVIEVKGKEITEQEIGQVEQEELINITAHEIRAEGLNNDNLNTNMDATEVICHSNLLPQSQQQLLSNSLNLSVQQYHQQPSLSVPKLNMSAVPQRLPTQPGKPSFTLSSSLKMETSTSSETLGERTVEPIVPPEINYSTQSTWSQVPSSQQILDSMLSTSQQYYGNHLSSSAPFCRDQLNAQMTVSKTPLSYASQPFSTYQTPQSLYPNNYYHQPFVYSTQQQQQQQQQQMNQQEVQRCSSLPPIAEFSLQPPNMPLLQQSSTLWMKPPQQYGSISGQQHQSPTSTSGQHNCTPMSQSTTSYPSVPLNPYQEEQQPQIPFAMMGEPSLQQFGPSGMFCPPMFLQQQPFKVSKSVTPIEQRRRKLVRREGSDNSGSGWKAFDFISKKFGFCQN